MTTTKIVVALLALTLLIAGCGGDDDDQADNDAATPTTDVAGTSNVTVLLRDDIPLDALSNHDDVSCTTVFFDDVVTVEVTLRTDDGTIIGSEKLDEVGGTFDAGCEWPVEFDQVPASDFYEVTVSVDGDEQTSSSPGGDDVTIEIDL